MQSFEKFLQLLKLQTKHVVGLFAVCGVFLLVPDTLLRRLGALKYREEGKPYFALVFGLASVLLVAAIYEAIQTKLSDYFLLRAAKKRFALMTAEEKEVLRRYIDGQTRTQNLSIESGIVQGLTHAGIIYRASSLSTYRTSFAYNIQSWAWEYLNEHRELLRTDPGTERA